MTNTPKQGLLLPDYSNCLVNLSNSILRAFGAETTAGTLHIADRYLNGAHKNVVILLLDAMGTSIMEKHLDEHGFFRSHLAGSFDSIYPPTTVAATTSLLSGLYPDEHGWLGWDIYCPGLDKNVTIFTNSEQMTEKKDTKPVSADTEGRLVWDEGSLADIKPAADYHVGFTLAPYRSIIDRINEAGGKAYYSMPFMPPYPSDTDAICRRIAALCREPGKKFIYAYWNEPDSTMHRTGTMSEKTHETIRALESMTEKLAEELTDTLLFVTADHSHIDCRNLCILDYPEVMNCLVRLPSIEPRTLNLFVKEDKRKIFPALWSDAFGDSFILLTREEALDKQLFGIGKNHPDLPAMTGDFIAVSISDVSIFNTHFEAQVTPGGHAGMTKEEYTIPLIVVEC